MHPYIISIRSSKMYTLTTSEYIYATIVHPDLCFILTCWTIHHHVTPDTDKHHMSNKVPEVTRYKVNKSTVLIVTLICLWHHQHVALYSICNFVFKIEMRRCSENKCMMYQLKRWEGWECEWEWDSHDEEWGGPSEVETGWKWNMMGKYTQGRC